jgi:hypothetical protein
LFFSNLILFFAHVSDNYEIEIVLNKNILTYENKIKMKCI